METAPQSQTRRLRFQSFELDLVTAELTKNGRRIRLQDQPARLLILLASRAGDLVTRTEIQKELWEEGRFVEFDHAVNTAIKKVREALDDDSDNPKIIETLPRKGYRFIAAIETVEDAVEEAVEEIAETPAAGEVSYEVPGVPGEPDPFAAPMSLDGNAGEQIQQERVLQDLHAFPKARNEEPAFRRTGTGRFAYVALVVFIAGLAIGAFLMRPQRSLVPEVPELRVEVMTPPTADPTSLAVSPDGMKIVYVAIAEGRSQLRLRWLDSGAERSLAGTDGALFPFWSPNSQSVAFFGDGSLKRVDIDGGIPRILAEAAAGRGGSWNKDDVILFTPNTGGPIFKVAASGETPATALTMVDAGSHRHPRFLPDGRHFLYFVTGTGETRGVFVGDVQGSQPSTRLPLQADAAVEFAAPKHLLFVSQGVLYAQEFDLDRLQLKGDAFHVAEEVTVDAAVNLAAVSASADGSLIYRTGSGGGERQFVWFDRKGQETERVGGPDSSGMLGPVLSSDGRHLALYRTVDGNSDIWLMELERGVRERVTLDTPGEVNPVWSPDKRRIAFSSNRDGAYDLYVKSTSSADTERVLKTVDPKSASSWSPDGRYLLYRTASANSSYDIWALPFDGSGKPGEAFPVVQTNFEERDAEFSPNGKWIAYQSTASGRSEVYVQSFPPVADSILLPVSTNGGAQPRWGSDSELFYIALDGQMMSVPIQYSSNGREIRPETPIALFPTRVGGAVHSNDRQQYVVSRDGKRFLMNTLSEANSPISIILHWKGRP